MTITNIFSTQKSNVNSQIVNVRYKERKTNKMQQSDVHY